jgi:hypothetical protein
VPQEKGIDNAKFYNLDLIQRIRTSVIFLKKIGSIMHSNPKFGWRGGGVGYIAVRTKGYHNTVLACVLRMNTQTGVAAHSVSKIPLIRT